MKLSPSIAGCFLAALMLNAPVFAAGQQGTGDTETDIADQWVSACGQNAVAVQRTGRVSRSDILTGIKTLRQAGLLAKIRQLNTSEACLTLVASGVVKTPAISLLEPLPETLPREKNPAMQFKPLEDTLMAKLRRLDLGYFVPAPGETPDSTYAQTYDQYPLEAKRASWQSLMLQVRSNQRSLSAHYQGYCVIINNQTSLTAYARKTFQGNLSHVLSNTDQRWLDDYGPAMEFWHEAAHCQLSPTANTYQPQVGAGKATHASPDGAECGASEFALQMNEIATGDKAIPGDVMQVYGRDIRILYELGVEVYADQTAQSILRDRFDVHQAGCRSPDSSADSPWARFRLADTAVNPSITHLTWLAPYLVNQSVPNQAHALSDAWAAVKTVAFEDITGPTKPSLIRMLVSKRPAGHSFSPTVKPNPEREQRWLAWLRAQLGL